jgi:hypothetical protein
MTDATFGRKRRARRARGRRIEDREAQRFGHWFRVEIDRFPVMTDKQAQAYLDSHRDQRAAARSFHSTPDGSGTLTVEQWAAARRTISRQQKSPTNH